MAGFGDWDQMEYEALMSRGRDAERTSLICWTAAGMAAAILISWGMAARNAGLMLPVVLAVAFGFYVMLHARQQVRLIAGYLKEFYESRGSSPQWFTRLGHLEVIPGFNPTGDWTVVALANATVAIAVIFAWFYAPVTAKGDLMAAIVTGFGIAFGFHSVSETARLRQSNPGAFWRQVVMGPGAESRGARSGGSAR